MPIVKILRADQLEFASLLRPGDQVVCGQGTAEPLSLTTRLVRDAPQIGAMQVFLGVGCSDTFLNASATSLELSSYGAIGTASKLASMGRLDVSPIHYSTLANDYACGKRHADVVLIQLAPPGSRGLNGGLAHDYVLDAAKAARLVIAEVNTAAPWTFGAELPDGLRVDICVEADRPPLELMPRPAGETERLIAELVSGLIPDYATMQIGVGSIPDTVLSSLMHHRDLGIHSGVIGDRVLDLIEAGVITNERKAIDTGVTICGNLFGSRRMWAWADQNPQLNLRAATYTHAPSTLAHLNRFIAINSAVEVDLSGQVNAEVANGTYVGAVGGQVDFVRGANASAGGRAIIALPSTAKHGTVSRIVPRLQTVSCSRSDVDVIVTEWGVAELAGATLAQRAQRLINIAAPCFRESLAREMHDQGMNA